jgi:hypothetical protein
MSAMPGWPGGVRPSPRDLIKNIGEPPPWPQKAKTILVNRLRALKGGCCGHPGEPGC